MTNREAYVFGWVFGRINAEVFPDDIGPDPWEACMRPYTCSAQVISAAHEKGLLSGDLDQQIGEALSEINSIEPEMDGGSEKVQPLEIQGSWQLGYYAGKGRRLLADAGFDIAAARKAKKTDAGAACGRYGRRSGGDLPLGERQGQPQRGEPGKAERTAWVIVWPLSCCPVPAASAAPSLTAARGLVLSHLPA